MARATETVHAYCAGLIDGEGCISIGKQYSQPKRLLQRRHYYNLAVIVVTKDEHLTKWLYGNYGGTVNVVTRGGWQRRGVYKRWVVHSVRAQGVLKDILPYLILKKDQARTAIEFQNWKSRHRHEQNFDRAKADEFYQRLKLQKRASVETNPSGPFVAKVCDSPALRVIGGK